MDEQDREEIAKMIMKTLAPEIRKEIKQTVNGKIDALSKIVCKEQEENTKHRAEVEPLLDLIKGGIVARKLVLWTTSLIIGVVASWVAIKSLF